MSEKQSHNKTAGNIIKKSQHAPVGSSVQILPLSHNEFQARWSLNQDALDAGLKAASKVGGDPHLVLRVYSLAGDSEKSAFSNIWKDYSINRTDSSAFFTLPKPSPRIKAVLGLIDKAGRFNPLVRGDAIELPPPPDPPPTNLLSAASETKGRMGKEIAYHSSPADAACADTVISPPRNDLSGNRFSRWEELWTKDAPVEIKAEFVLTGKIAPGTKLLLGNEIVEPTPEGFIRWKRKLDSFEQIQPLLEQALSSPSSATEPSLELFRDVDSPDRLLDLHAGLEIQGRISDPNYRSELPEEVTLDAHGNFKLNRMLPDGAVILAGLSLIAKN